jgi:predicted nucleotide-binding protein
MLLVRPDHCCQTHSRVLVNEDVLCSQQLSFLNDGASMCQAVRILRLPSLREKRSAYSKWRQDAKIVASKLRVNRKLTLRMDGLADDLAVLQELARKSGERGRGDKRSVVFVVVGRNKKVHDNVFAFLRAIGLKPLEWAEAVALAETPTPFVGEILEKAFEQAQAILVVFTGDDEARLRKELSQPEDDRFELELTAQPRPNVILEAGMAFGRDPERTVVIEIGKMRPVSDWAGRHFIRMDGSPRRRKELAERLKSAKCKVDTSGSDWLEAGSFH